MVLRAFKVIISKSGEKEDGREDLLTPKRKAPRRRKYISSRRRATAAEEVSVNLMLFNLKAK